MPVTFGTTQSLSGAGTWTYPDVGLVIGLKLDVTAFDEHGKTWGTEIVRYRDIGVWAPITEAGTMHAQPVWNGEEVTYDIGNGPVGLAYDLAPGTTINATEILSESPPSGGGGSAVTAHAQLDNNTGHAVPSGAYTQVNPDTQSYFGDTTVMSLDGAGGVNILKKGVYLLVADVWFDVATTISNLTASFYVNGVGYWSAGGAYEPGIPGYRVNTTFSWQLNVSDLVTCVVYQDAGSDQTVFPVYTVTLLGLLS